MVGATALIVAALGFLPPFPGSAFGSEGAAVSAPVVQTHVPNTTWGLLPPVGTGAGGLPAAIDKKNLPEYARILAPGLVGLIHRGWSIQVGAASHVALPSAFAAATAKYAGAVVFARDSVNLDNYVAGLPFETVDGADPNAAARLILNFDAAAAVDDLEIKLIACDAGMVTTQGLEVNAHFLLDTWRRLSFIGRLEVAPRPAFQVNSDDVRFKEAAYPLIEPFDQKGTGLVAYRYIDYLRPSDTWLYLPQTRRVRRLSTVQRSDPLVHQDFDLDSVSGFSGDLAFFDWRLLGEATLLAPLHAVEDAPAVENATIPTRLPGEVWEPRSVWILEARPKRADYGYGKRVLYLDKESYRIPVTELYDRADQLWKTVVTAFAAPPILKAPEVSDVARESIVASRFGIFDLKLGRATVCEAPSVSHCKTPPCPRGGWHINEGKVTEEQFELTVRLGGR